MHLSSASVVAALCAAPPPRPPPAREVPGHRPPPPSRALPATRRRWLAHGLLLPASSAALSSARPPDAAAATARVDPRRFTALAPLGAPASTGDKETGLSPAAMAARLARDLAEGSTGQGGYFVSGDISAELFRDDCEFVDPTNSVASLSRYRNALGLLFDPEQSYVRLLGPPTVEESTRHITARIRSGGVLRLPWRPRIPAYESVVTYTLGDDGLIARQEQEWSISAAEALAETFTPAALAAPYSARPRPSTEPVEVTELFDLVNGRRPQSHSPERRHRIDRLIDQIADERYEWKDGDLPGKWALAYLQPGPEGGGVDRRIPFPDLPFNNNYQIFSARSVTNVGEVLGSLLEVRVGGGLLEEIPGSRATPKRFRASIEEGGLCLGDGDERCVPLPIKGEGIFDGVYVGERLRIGQNINGGGARVIQVKLA